MRVFIQAAMSLQKDWPFICWVKVNPQLITAPQVTSRQKEDGSMETASMEEMWPEDD